MFFFFFFYASSVILTLSCSDWFLVWIGLEINMMSFIALIWDRSSLSVEVCLKYFFVQSLGSGILMMMFYTNFWCFDYISLVILSYKMGGGPFFFWFPSVCENLSWGCCTLLMTVQKILPLLLVSFLVSMFLWVIILVSIIVGAVGSLNQVKIKRLMAFSSVHHIGWILTGNFVSEFMWFVYLLMYSLLIVSVVWNLSKGVVFYLGEVMKMSDKWGIMLSMLSMGGMPPMLGFFIKWWMFYNIMEVDYSILLLMIVMSVLMFYVYLRVVYNMLMKGFMNISWEINMVGKNFLSMDLLHMLGVNVGVIFWMMMM